MYILGHFGDCTSNNPCGEDEGDCDNDVQCKEGFKCGTNNCRSSLGFHSLFDCCYNEDEDFCTIDSPCGVDEGDCDSHDMCQVGLLCGLNNCPEEFDNTTDCCHLPVAGEKDFCLSGIPCGVDDGDCDSDKECASELFCGSNNCPDYLGFDFEVDCCYNLTSNTLISPNYPNFHILKEDFYTWLLTADVNLIINLQFQSFQVSTYFKNCVYSYKLTMTIMMIFYVFRLA